MVLLVAAVELQQLNSVFREANVDIAEFSQQWVAQIVAVQLPLLCLGERLIHGFRHCQGAFPHPEKDFLI